LATRSGQMDSREYREWILFWLAAMAMLVIDLVTLYWVGMWRALVARNPHRATGGSLARILVLPWLILAVLGLLVSLSVIATHSDPGQNFFLGLWFVVGVGVDLWFGLRARHRLLTEFRQVAAQRYAARPGWVRRLFSGRSTTQADVAPAASISK
jgi:hypothetical protein